MFKASSQHHSQVFHWLKLSLDLIQQCANPTKLSTRKLHGNQKVLKASLEYIASFAEMQKSKGKKLEWSTCEKRFERNSVVIKELIIWLVPRAGKMNQIARCD